MKGYSTSTRMLFRPVLPLAVPSRKGQKSMASIVLKQKSPLFILSSSIVSVEAKDKNTASTGFSIAEFHSYRLVALQESVHGHIQALCPTKVDKDEFRLLRKRVQ